ncbi:MAG: efflux RND transporter periplasmic adaptor subunit [Desulfobacteraceae bacterium]|nr:MAG: efflux RND transporter periplasmic adaptor subunit [Desulfobacteraceae bacterium]
MAGDEISKLRIKKAGTAAGTGRKKKYIIFLIIIFVLIAAWILYKQGHLTPALEVRISKVVNIYPSQTYTLLNASGYVVAQRKAAVASKITGRLVFLGVEEGSRVRKGEIVARLENEDAIAARNRAVANVNAARASLEQAMAELDDSLLNFNRMEQLSKRGSVAKSEHDAAETRMKRAKASVSAQKAAVQAGEAALKETEVMLEYANMRAPFDAVVLTKNADIGDIVTPIGAAANAKAAVVDIADMGSLQIEVDVSESNIDLVKKGQPCEIRLDALQDSRFRGAVHMIVPTADRAKASIMVKVAFTDKDPRILPEMSAKVAFLSREILPEEQKSFKAVPAGAITGKEGNQFVFSVKKDRANKIMIKTGRPAGDMTEVISGLETGEVLVTEPLDKVKDGMKVKVLEE